MYRIIKSGIFTDLARYINYIVMLKVVLIEWMVINILSSIDQNSTINIAITKAMTSISR